MKICLAIDGKAKTYDSVCEAMKELNDQKDVVTIMVSMGVCADLLSKESNNSKDQSMRTRKLSSFVTIMFVSNVRPSICPFVRDR